MKKILFFVIFIFLTLALTASVKEPKKIYNLQKAYVFLDESLLISDTDLNCSYFIKDDMPQDIRIVASYQSVAQRKDFSDNDYLIIDKGSKDGMKKGNLLLIISRGKSIKNLGRYFLKKSLAEITDIYDNQSVIRLKDGCNPVTIGDFAIPFKPEKTLFAKKIDFMLARIPANPVSGNVVYTDLSLGMPAVSVATSQYATVDLGTGVVAKGTFLLICRNLKSDLPLLIIGLAIVIHTENTNSTVKILDANAPVRENDQVFVLRAVRAATAAAAKAGKGEEIPIVETLQVESQEKENAQPGGEPQDGSAQPAEQKGDSLVVDVLFEFDGKQPKGDHWRRFYGNQGIY